VRKWGSRVYERRVATIGGCDNWIERGSEGMGDVITGWTRFGVADI
jgi:hypothetical protein